jgi:hypothetical protein
MREAMYFPHLQSSDYVKNVGTMKVCWKLHIQNGTTCIQDFGHDNPMHSYQSDKTQIFSINTADYKTKIAIKSKGS